MANNTATQTERDELHKRLWDLSNTLRGSVDGWDFKQYVLGTMFYRFISENLAEYINENERDSDNNSFDYASLPDVCITEEIKNEIVTEKGFFIYPSQLFRNVCKKIRIANGTAPESAEIEINICKDFCENLNTNIEKIFHDIEASAIGTDSEAAIKGLFSNFEVNSINLGDTTIKRTKKLATILLGIEEIDFGKLKEKKIDVFGDAYEYLMGMYASDAGKVGGEYFTPQEVAKLLAKLATSGKSEVNKVYDPACGSGSLLLQVAKTLGSNNIRIGFFGQEINPTTYNLCRINMFLHDVGYDKFSVACEDTLLAPQHWDDEPFDIIVSNPPYSIPWKCEDDATLINDPRFSPAGVLAPKNRSDFAFILHSLAWLSSSGTGAFVCFPGILYRTDTKAEPKIRRYLIDNNFVDAVIDLPPNMFFGVSISTSIMVLKKNKTDNSVLFVDASNEFYKDGNKNKMSDENIDTIFDLYHYRQDKQYISRVVHYDEIVENDYNLSVSTYIEKEDKREKINIVELNAEIKEIVAREQILRGEIDRFIADIERTNA